MYLIPDRFCANSSVPHFTSYVSLRNRRRAYCCQERIPQKNPITLCSKVSLEIVPSSHVCGWSDWSSYFDTNVVYNPYLNMASPWGGLCSAVDCNRLMMMMMMMRNYSSIVGAFTKYWTHINIASPGTTSCRQNKYLLSAGIEPVSRNVTAGQSVVRVNQKHEILTTSFTKS